LGSELVFSHLPEKRALGRKKGKCPRHPCKEQIKSIKCIREFETLRLYDF